MSRDSSLLGIASRVRALLFEPPHPFVKLSQLEGDVIESAQDLRRVEYGRVTAIRVTDEGAALPSGDDQPLTSQDADGLGHGVRRSVVPLRQLTCGVELAPWGEFPGKDLLSEQVRELFVRLASVIRRNRHS